MNYKNAAQILPPALLRQVQEFVDGEYLYIPRIPEQKRAWGETSHIRQELAERNRRIYDEYIAGMCPEELAKRYYLSAKSIRRIIGRYK